MNTKIRKKPLTVQDIRAAKGVRKLAVLTAYDYSTACMVDAGGVDVVLVGDSLGMVVLGQKDTVGVTLDAMIHHTKAVMGGVQEALVVADMPFMTYESGVEQALASVAKLVQHSGVRAVKLEGGRNIVPQVEAIVQAGIAVAGHVGLTPQRATTLGGFTVQGKHAESAISIVEDAIALEKAGCFCLVVEAVPAPLAALITAKVGIPIIGIGAGAECDGQVLVIYDMLGLTQGHVPRFVRKYADFGEQGRQAVQQYVTDIRQGAFPSEQESFSMSAEEEAKLLSAFDRPLHS